VSDANETQAASEAYKRLARELHPDMGGSDAAMQDLNTLRDATKKFTFSFAEPAEAEVAVDSRQESEKPQPPVVDSLSNVGDATRQMYADLQKQCMPFCSAMDFRSEMMERRDAACKLIEWRMGDWPAQTWGVPQETRYRARLAEEREYWQNFVKPSESVSAQMIAERLGELFCYPLKVGRQWASETLAQTAKELGLHSGIIVAA
jgi:hypothetical protein